MSSRLGNLCRRRKEDPTMQLRFVRKPLFAQSTRNEYILNDLSTLLRPRSLSTLLTLTFPVSILPLLSLPSLLSAHLLSVQTRLQVRSHSALRVDLPAHQLQLFLQIDDPPSLTLLSASPKTQLRILDDHLYRVYGRKRHILERRFDKRWECQRLGVKVRKRIEEL